MRNYICIVNFKTNNMKIAYFIQYRNPVGSFVEDFVTYSQLKFLLKKGIVLPYDYQLRGNFWYKSTSCLYLEFVYRVRSFFFS